jgi:hypothetical protein
MEFTPQQFARLIEWFNEALDLTPPERANFVGKVRREEGDEMADWLARLLEAGNQPTGTPTDTILQPVAPLHSETTTFRAGEVILGRFRIVRALGRAGWAKSTRPRIRNSGRWR